MTVAVSLPTLYLSEDEAALIREHAANLGRFRRRNKVKEAYFEGKQRVRNLGINLPANLRDVETVVGWPATTVEVLEERLDFLGWYSDSDDDLGLGDVYTDNGLDVDAGLGHTDALVTGTGFVIAGAGDVDEPEVLLTVESPNRVTGTWDRRMRRLSSALSIDEDGDYGEPSAITLYLPNVNVACEKRGGVWYVVDRDEHNLGRVLVAMLPSRVRASRPDGRSEITPAIRAYTDAAVRTLLGMDVHREFYQAPQRYLLGAEEQMFKKGDGSTATGWETVLGRMLAVPRDEDGELPQIGQFNPSSPTPYLEQVRGLAQMVSAEGAIPPNYLGFTSENPPSADAIRAQEARLIKRAERRQAVFGRGWREVGALALLVRDGEIPEDYRRVAPKWRDAATPTRAAAADEVSKYVAAGVLPADSRVTYDRMGLSAAEQRILASEKRRAAASDRLTALASAAQAARAPQAVPGAPGQPPAVEPGQEVSADAA